MHRKQRAKLLYWNHVAYQNLIYLQNLLSISLKSSHNSMQMREQLPNGRALNKTILQKTVNLLLPLFSAQTTCADSCDGHKMRPTIKQGRRNPCRQLFSPQWRHSLSCSQNYISNIIHNLLPRSARQQRRGRWSCSAFLLLARPFLYSGITLLLLLSCSCPSGSLGQSFLRNFHSKRPKLILSYDLANQQHGFDRFPRTMSDG